jgi:ferredoxin, 2Fe-2S
MPMLTIMPAGKTIEVAEGVSVLGALLSSGENIMHKCDGKAQCGSCHIFVHEGRKSVSKMESAENQKLDMIVGVGSKSRLACQTRLGAENVTIELLGFASGL